MQRFDSFPSLERESQRRKDIHQQIVQEFRDHLATQEYDPSVETDGVVSLSGPPDIQESGTVENTPENIRSEYSISLIKQITAKRVGKEIGEVDQDGITDWNPSGFYNLMYSLAKAKCRTPEK